MKQNPDIGNYPILEFYSERKNNRFKWKRFIRPACNVGDKVWFLPWKRVSERTWKDLASYRKKLGQVWKLRQ